MSQSAIYKPPRQNRSNFPTQTPPPLNPLATSLPSPSPASTSPRRAPSAPSFNRNTSLNFPPVRQHRSPRSPRGEGGEGGEGKGREESGCGGGGGGGEDFRRSRRWTVLELDPWLLIRPETETTDSSVPESTILMPDVTQLKKEKGGKGEGKGEGGKGGGRGEVFGVPFRDIRPGGGLLIPLIVVQCVEYMRANCLGLQGIFRISAVKNLIDQTKKEFKKSKWVPLEQTIKDPHVVSCILKLFFRETPEPLFPFSIWDHLLETYREGEEKGEEEKEQTISSYIKILQSISAVNLATILYIFSFLDDLRKHSEKTLMTAQNLGIIFGPGLLRPPKVDPLMSLGGWDGKIIEQLLENYDDIFSKLGIVTIEGSWDNGDYRESFSGYIATALRPRFRVNFVRKLGTKAICKCNLVSTSPGTSGAQAFTVGVEEKSTVQEFVALVTKRAKDVLRGNRLQAICIQEGCLDPILLSPSDNVYTILKSPAEKSLELRVIDKMSDKKTALMGRGRRKEEKECKEGRKEGRRERKEGGKEKKKGVKEEGRAGLAASANGLSFGKDFDKRGRRGSWRGEGGEGGEGGSPLLLSASRQRGGVGGEGGVVKPARPNRVSVAVGGGGEGGGLEGGKTLSAPGSSTTIPSLSTSSPLSSPHSSLSSSPLASPRGTEESEEQIEFLILDEQERKIALSPYATVFDFLTEVYEMTGYHGWVFIIHSEETYFYNPCSSDLMVNLLSTEDEGSLILQGYTMVVRYLGVKEEGEGEEREEGDLGEEFVKEEGGEGGEGEGGEVGEGGEEGEENEEV